MKTSLFTQNAATEVFLTRVYRFSSAHRLCSPSLTERENFDIYGKCSNPKGHGHNYVLELTVRGEPDRKTGMLLDVRKLDELVQEKILLPWDHRHLDEEVDDFKEKMSTGENIVRIVWEKLKDIIPGCKLSSVKLGETSNSFFEYRGG